MASTASTTSDAVTWKDLGRYAAVTLFFLGIIGFFVVRDRDGLQKGLDANATAIRSLEVETVKSLAAIREQLVETNANLKNLVVETRKNGSK